MQRASPNSLPGVQIKNEFPEIQDVVNETTTPATPGPSTPSNSTEHVNMSKRRRQFESLNKTVTLLVGKEQEKLLVHDSVICSQNPFFEGLLKKKWSGLGEKVFTLLEDDPGIMRAIISWLYSDKIWIPNSKDDSDIFHLLRIEFLVRLYVSAHKYRFVQLTNHITDAIIDELDEASKKSLDPRNFFPFKWLHYLYKGTPSESVGLRKLFVRFAADHFMAASIEAWRNLFPKDFTIELLKFLLPDPPQAGSSPNSSLFPFTFDWCERYHEHVQGQQICENMKHAERD